MHQVGIAGLVWGSLVEGPEVTEALREWWWRGVEGWNLAMLLVQPGLVLAAWPATFAVPERKAWIWL